MSDPLFTGIRPGSREDMALRDYIADRRRRIFADLASLNCDERAGNVCRGRLVELDDMEHSLTPHTAPSDKE